MPAALKDWSAINKSRPEDPKKVAQKTRKFLPVTDTVIESHLLGKETIGVYPLLPDETCWLLAADFDKKSWEQDAESFLETCEELSLPAALDRSRSGKGGHVWIFFEHPIPATTARKLGCVILTRTTERRHQLGLDSYDRFFPNQDTMPKGNGDLIGVRFGVADDEDGQDPWTMPPSRKRIERPIAGPLPKTVQIVRANLVYVENKDLPPARPGASSLQYGFDDMLF